VLRVKLFKLGIIILATLIANSCLSSNDFLLKENPEVNKKLFLKTTYSLSYASSLYFLDKLWYSDYPRSNFHFINDNKNWMFMDKLGHAFTSYQLGIYGYNSFKWAGYDEMTSILYGGLSGSIFLSAVEIMDGFSSQWGASYGDFFANSAGSILFIGQQLIFDTQKINLKFSYFPSKTRVENKRLLGNNEIEAIFKDYNAQNYWLTFNLQEILNINSNNNIEWLNIAIGYGANNLIQANNSNNSTAYRQYFLSLDVDFSKVNIENKLLEKIVKILSFIKIPAPTLEFSKNNVIFHKIYF
tara:strand:+ start:29 stop:925 length:897 start_codon:yes stop_codon:yes gene_type:complete